MNFLKRKQSVIVVETAKARVGGKLMGLLSIITKIESIGGINHPTLLTQTSGTTTQCCDLVLIVVIMNMDCIEISQASAQVRSVISFGPPH